MRERGDGRRDAARHLVAKGSELAAGAVTGALVALAGDPGIAAVLGASGVAVTQVIQRLGSEVNQRYLGEREEVRIGAAMAFAIEQVHANRERGLQVRQDGFFHKQPGERAAAEEVLEGVLLAAQREHEEKKVRFCGYLFANITFTPSVDRAQANNLIRLAEALSYRQLCLLHLFQNDPTPYLHGRSRFDPFGIPSRAGALTSLVQEIYDLDARGLASGHEIEQGYDCGATLPRGAATIGQVFKPRAMGSVLYELMDLEEIDEADLETIRAVLPQYRLRWEDVEDWRQGVLPPRQR